MYPGRATRCLPVYKGKAGFRRRPGGSAGRAVLNWRVILLKTIDALSKSPVFPGTNYPFLDGAVSGATGDKNPG